MVTDITLGAGRTTSAASAAKYLKDQGVDILVDNIVNVLAINQVYKGVDILVDNIVNVLAINQIYKGVDILVDNIIINQVYKIGGYSCR